LYGLFFVVEVFAAEYTQPAVVVTDELELAELLSALVAEVRIALRAGHVIAPSASLDEDL